MCFFSLLRPVPISPSAQIPVLLICWSPFLCWFECPFLKIAFPEWPSLRIPFLECPLLRIAFPEGISFAKPFSSLSRAGPSSNLLQHSGLLLQNACLHWQSWQSRWLVSRENVIQSQCWDKKDRACPCQGIHK